MWGGGVINIYIFCLTESVWTKTSCVSCLKVLQFYNAVTLYLQLYLRVYKMLWISRGPKTLWMADVNTQQSPVECSSHFCPAVYVYMVNSTLISSPALSVFAAMSLEMGFLYHLFVLLLRVCCYFFFLLLLIQRFYPVNLRPCIFRMENRDTNLCSMFFFLS